MTFRDRERPHPGQARWVLPCANDRNFTNGAPEIGDLVILKDDTTEKLVAFKVQDIREQLIVGQHRPIHPTDKNTYPEQVAFSEQKVCVIIK